MGKIAVVQAQQDVPGNASREVFQGLFKDLGKQAMALEAILRAVCGRVDKMENWLTEVSFGMTELDLKLRNIAHNIDGTSAVDDEGHLPKRWAIPPADDVEPIAPTVSKRLGNDKKAVRVTGMAAAILDRLATTSTATSPPTGEPEKVDKANTKKKIKDKKRSTKKVKSSGFAEVPNVPLPAVAESLPAEKIIPPKLEVVAPETPVTNVSQADSDIVAAQVTVDAPEPASLLSKKTLTPRNDVIEATEQANVSPSEVTTVNETPSMIEETNVSQGEKSLEEEHHAEVEPEILPPQDTRQTEKDTSKFPEFDQSNDQSGSSSSDSSPVNSAREVTNSNVAKEVQSSDTVSREKPETSDVQPPTSEDNVVFESAKTPEEETMSVVNPAVSSIVNPGPTVLPLPVKQEDDMLVSQSSVEEAIQAPSKSLTHKVEHVALDVDKPKQIIPASIASVSSVLPTVHSERTPEPFELRAPANSTTKESTPPQSIKVSSVIPETKPTAPKLAPAVAPSTVKSMVISNSMSEPKAGDNIPEPSQLKTVPVPEPAATNTATTSLQDKPGSVDTANDPLITHRSNSLRRSSKAISRPSSGRKLDPGSKEASRRQSGNKSGSRRTSVVPAKIEETEPVKAISQPVLQTPPAQQLVSQVTAILPQEALTAVNATERSDDGEDSSDSSSEGSSNGSGSSGDDDEEHEDDDDAEAAVEDISKTMIALKKLKRAQMLSPEEENELKERAHKKWFQLKGHIKEKQKKDVTNILLKRKKNVFTVSSRIELLEEKSREIFAALKQFTNEMRDKNDRATHETLRRRVADIEHSLQSVDSRVAALSAPAIEKVSDLEMEVNSLRTTVQLQITTAQSEATARHFLLEEALANQRVLIESLAQDVPAQLNSQAELFYEKLKQQPDYSAAFENLKRSIRRKADLKLLKELEARILGLDAENEDCLVRCLSCRKEVLNPYNEVETPSDEQDSSTGGGGASQLRKVNPGPSSARVYRSNVPFSAQPMVPEPILEESSEQLLFSPQQSMVLPQTIASVMKEPQQLQQQLQSAGDSYANEKPPVVRVPSVKWSTPAVENPARRESKVQASPLSLMNITATRAILSPDRPISAPVVTLKKKPTSAARSKSLLKSLPPQLEPPQ